MREKDSTDESIHDDEGTRSPRGRGTEAYGGDQDSEGTGGGDALTPAPDSAPDRSRESDDRKPSTGDAADA